MDRLFACTTHPGTEIFEIMDMNWVDIFKNSIDDYLLPFVGDIGRKLGEMWHALSEGDKEEYRRRARELSDQKMVEYQKHLATMPPQQRQLAIHASNAPAKKRKTHGYAIFSAEMRKNLGNAMSPQETANVIGI